MDVSLCWTVHATISATDFFGVRMIRYMDLGGDRTLNDIVMAGSHDAGITTGASNAQTQVLDIGAQARAGVRFFDLRVAAFSSGAMSYGAKQVELKAFHADGMIHKKDKDKTRSVVGFQGTAPITRSKLKFGEGAEGMGLRKMLEDARGFVTSADYSGEFLILKFDKCTNWELIAATCRSVLGGTIYKKGGNLNIKKLSDLSGSVICAFMESGYDALKTPGSNVNITKIKNLYKPPSDYDNNFQGLQYWGSGGTGINNKGYEGKIRENIEKQKKVMASAQTGVAPKTAMFSRKVTPGCAASDPRAIGVMYWTTTGLKKSILTRDATMWNDNNKSGLQSIWQSGFDIFMGEALPQHVPMTPSAGGIVKMFMPNVVMIDFADEPKCKHIYDLNDLATARLIDICQKMGM